jgi:hypothetical protein
MATELIRAIEKGGKLQLGYLLSSEDTSSSDGNSSSEDTSNSDSNSSSDGSSSINDSFSIDDSSSIDHCPYCAIFIFEDDAGREDNFICEEPSEQVLSNASCVFTTWKPSRHLETKSGVRNMDKYVSIEADLDGVTEGDLLHLRTKRWIKGLCFFLMVVLSWMLSFPDQLGSLNRKRAVLL